MATLVLFKNYNNYFNRRIKNLSYENMIANYDYETLTNINFNPNDELSTEQIINWSKNWTPDYLIEIEGEQQIKIVRRWFVIDTNRTRKGQYNVVLKRDVITDNINGLATGVFSIDRCTLNPDNPLIYNKEGFNYNQIKKAEYKLTDKTNSPWIVGYMEIDSDASHTFSYASDFDVDMRNTRYADWQYISKIGTHYGPASLEEAQIGIQYARNWWIGGYEGCFLYNGPSVNYSEYYNTGIGLNNENVRYSESDLNIVRNADRKNWWSWETVNNYEASEHPAELSEAEITNLTALNGKKVLFSDGVYYINFTTETSTVKYDNLNNTVTQYIVNTLAAHAPQGEVKHTHLRYYKTSRLKCDLSASFYSSASQVSWKIPSSANPLIDAPYKMFCLPLPFSKHILYVDDHLQSSEINFQVAMDILKSTTTSKIIDMQILPYCPVTFEHYWIGNTNRTTLLDTWTNSIENVDYSNITNTFVDEGETVTVDIGKIYFPKSSSFKFSTKYVLAGEKDTRTLISSIDYFKITNKKIQNETQFVRFCDSTYTSVFEMSPAKNEGISSLNMFCTYKPYNPYILVAPNFGGLYGANFEDSRGLLCLGDYSLPNIDDAWQTYELNNKTYQQAFNREITHMEKEQAIQRQESAWQIASGAVSGTASGAIAGGMVGGGWGAVAGAVVGGASSIAGGVMDYQNLGKRQAEEISYRKDLFNYSLQNIKAMPSTLTKTSAIVANTKYVPFLECYDATDEEKQILSDFIEYNGMKAGYVGPVNTHGYVKASVIKYNEPLAPQEVNEINNELMRGLYFE